MPTFFVTLSLFLVTFSASFSFADNCLDLNQQNICYDIEGVESIEGIEWSELKQQDSRQSESMIVASDLAQNQMDSILVLSSGLFRISGESIEPSIYEAFTKADDLYYRFAYKILDRNNGDTTVVITRD